MSTGDDDDLKLQRASASLQSDLQQLLPRLLQKRKHDLVSAHLMHTVCSLIDPFQEDPQLLDTHLQTLIPPLVAGFLRSLQATCIQKLKKGYVPLTYAICYILNLFCKVRGEKVIKRFFNNEPRYLEPILDQIDVIRKSRTLEKSSSQQHSAAPWVERYVLLLWLSHLMLTPFPLDSLSVPQPSKEMQIHLGIELPAHVPGVTLRVLAICFECLQSASKERGAAASLLVRLCLRPDMQKVGLLRMLVHWATTFLAKASETQAEIHHYLGVLSFLSGLIASANNLEIGPHLPVIYQSCQNILDQDCLSQVKSSAVARKTVVKIKRNIVIHALRSNSAPGSLNATSILEEVIEFLLEVVADGDSPVRYGASKALGVITLKLDLGMGDEVVDAILDSLNASVYWQGSKRNLSGVNSLRWHGLTLTLSHLLYRKAISTQRLPEVLNALLLSLSFEQRSPTGGSIGTNVRDAACFGIWALARRYASSDLLCVETTTIRACEQRKTMSVPQALAVELVTAACLDPAGNIRRGSSAALQELIGRHPDTVEDGIALVQIVDFHAVGLRQRAMCEVAIAAGELQQVYRESLFENLLGWRGIGSLDAESRLAAAAAIGHMSKMRSADTIRNMANQIRDQLATLRPREVEERQGLVSALAAIVRTAYIAGAVTGLAETYATKVTKQLALTHLWALLDKELILEDTAFTSPALRPDLTASSIAHFIAALAAMTKDLIMASVFRDSLPITRVTHILSLCLSRHEDSVLEAVVVTTPAVLSLLSVLHCAARAALVPTWLSVLETEASFDGVRCAGYTVALGSAYAVLDGVDATNDKDNDNVSQRKRIISVLTFRCTAAVAIEARIVSLRALHALIKSSSQLSKPVEDQICSALHIALNDYTITERGDVGSLVRLEALDVIGSGWTRGTLCTEHRSNNLVLYSDVLRLSLEKLDKARSRAAETLALYPGAEEGQTCTSTVDVSTTTYFLKALRLLQDDNPLCVTEGVCLGFSSSAGMGSESVLQHARAALLKFTSDLPDDDTKHAGQFSLLTLSTCLLTYLNLYLNEDRISIPLLEVIAFLFDMQVLQRLVSTTFNFRTLLSLTQKSHFKSSNMKKLHLALDLYRGLGTISITRSDTLKKTISMLMHPFAKIRMTAAETLWVLTRDDTLRLQDWSMPSKSLKPAVYALKDRLATFNEG